MVLIIKETKEGISELIAMPIPIVPFPNWIKHAIEKEHR